MKLIRLVVLHPVFFVLLFFGCSTKAHERIEHVERVFMHDVNEYSFMMRDPQTRELRVRKIVAKDVMFLRDVPLDQEMWIEHIDSGGCEHSGGNNASLTIHLRGAAEAEGGRTVPIE